MQWSSGEMSSVRVSGAVAGTTETVRDSFHGSSTFNEDPKFNSRGAGPRSILTSGMDLALIPMAGRGTDDRAR